MLIFPDNKVQRKNDSVDSAEMVPITKGKSTIVLCKKQRDVITFICTIKEPLTGLVKSKTDSCLPSNRLRNRVQNLR